MTSATEEYRQREIEACNRVIEACKREIEECARVIQESKLEMLKANRQIAKARLFAIRMKRVTDVINRFVTRFDLIAIPVLAAWVFINLAASYLFELPMTVNTEGQVLFGLVVIIICSVRRIKPGFESLRNKDKQ